MIQVDDLAGLLVKCASSERAAGRTFLAGDPKAVSTTRLLVAMRAALGRPARLFSLPAPFFKAGAAILGRADAMRRLTRHLEVDVSETMRSLEWAPEIGVEAGIGQMARAHREAQGP
jgi:nucleoside-diphosphate-sugar epimerase